MPNVQYRKSFPVVAEPDVLVCGTGLAGIGAAVAAARNGASVLATANVILDPASAMTTL